MIKEYEELRDKFEEDRKINPREVLPAYTLPVSGNDKDYKILIESINDTSQFIKVYLTGPTGAETVEIYKDLEKNIPMFDDIEIKQILLLASVYYNYYNSFIEYLERTRKTKEKIDKTREASKKINRIDCPDFVMNDVKSWEKEIQHFEKNELNGLGILDIYKSTKNVKYQYFTQQFLINFYLHIKRLFSKFKDIDIYKIAAEVLHYFEWQPVYCEIVYSDKKRTNIYYTYKWNDRSKEFYEEEVKSNKPDYFVCKYWVNEECEKWTKKNNINSFCCRRGKDSTDRTHFVKSSINHIKKQLSREDVRHDNRYLLTQENHTFFIKSIVSPA